MGLIGDGASGWSGSVPDRDRGPGLRPRGLGVLPPGCIHTAVPGQGETTAWGHSGHFHLLDWEVGLVSPAPFPSDGK